jgi:NADPH:quinone reductase-like Zn-dependent oxidoreductase
VPEPGTGDVLVRVHAASFTPTELTWDSTWVDRLAHDRRPVIPGHEVSGTVDSLGFGTTGFAIGDAVYGLTDWYRDGTLATYVAVEARNLAPKPASLNHVQAAALPMPGLTAWQALFVHGRLSAGHRVLIHGAGGGVGTAAVQLARAARAHVIASGHGSARNLVSELGAERFVDLDRERFEDLAEKMNQTPHARSWITKARIPRTSEVVAGPFDRSPACGVEVSPRSLNRSTAFALAQRVSMQQET